MADKKRIRFARGTSEQRATVEETSVAGHPIYETDTQKLYIGDGTTAVKDLEDIKVTNADNATEASHSNAISYQTTLPTSDNTSKQIKFVICKTTPTTRYNGYVYLVVPSYSGE